MQRSRRRMTFLFIAFIVSAVVLGALFYRKYERSHMPVVPPPAREPMAGTTIVTLFFADPGGQGLRRELREIGACNELPDCIEAVIHELVNGPLGDLGPTLPGSFALRAARVVGDMAVLDLQKGTGEGLPEGSSAEMMAIYSIVDSIAFNFPPIHRVQFLMDGQSLTSLKGHLDLREPLVPDFLLETK
ncbi:MAG TPA: GerMN domain-containing protein [Geobacteraceae bacterium]